MIGLSIGLSITSQRVRAAGGAPEPENFITNGGFDSGASWATGAGWTIAAGVATQTADSGELGQNFGPLTASLINGNNYLLSYNVVAGDGGGDIVPTLGGTQALSSHASSIGLKTRSFTANAAHSTLSFHCLDGAVFSIDNVKIEPA